ncbi:hypothetical protein CR513_52106, partial [Mucuna pruriens]
MPSTIYEITRIFGSMVATKSFADSKISSVFHLCHATVGGGHHGSTRIARKVLDCRFYWPTIFETPTNSSRPANNAREHGRP